MMHRPHAVMAALLLGTSLLLTSCATGNPPQRVVDLLGGPAAYALVDAPTGDATVEAYRLLPPHRAGEVELPEDSIEMHGNQVLAGPVAVDAESIALLSDVLTNDSTYEWDMAKACEFMPGVAIRYAQGDLELDILLCFSCDELGVYRNGKRVDIEDFDSRRRDLVAVAKRLFPGDEKIQSLEP